MPGELVTTLADLVAIPSVNPMGRPADGPEFYEAAVTDYLQRYFTKLDVRWQRQTVEPRRDNIVARFDGDPPPEKGGAVLLWDAHQDTVPVDGMIIPPWTPDIRDGRLYGRGSCDIKGGMAAMLTAFSRVVRQRPAGRPTLIMACTVNEEYGFSGVNALTRMWEPRAAGGIIPRRPDAAVVAEPTSLQVVIAHRGSVRVRMVAKGRAAHSSTPHLGQSAIYRMAPILQAIEAYHLNVIPTLPTHALCGGPTVSVGMIRGGLSINTVPAECSIDIDRRIIPGEDGLQALTDLEAHVRTAISNPDWFEMDKPWHVGVPLADGPNRRIAERLAGVVRSFNTPCELIGVPYGTNAAPLQAAGLPSVVFGPGSIDQAHTADEWLPLDELEAATEMLYKLVAEWRNKPIN